MTSQRLSFLLTLMLPLLAQGQETPSDRLAAAKNALIDQALSQPTRVRSAAWIDDQGVLHEQTRFTSEGSVRGGAIRGIRMPAYLPAQAAPPSAPEGETLLAPDAMPETVAVAENVADACAAFPGLALSAVLRVEQLTAPHHVASGYAQRLEQAVHRLLLRRFEGEPGWRLAPARDSESQGTAYERAVYANARNRRPLELTLALAVRKAPAKAPWWHVAARATEPFRDHFGPFRQSTPALSLDLELRLTTPGDPAFLWVGYESLPLGPRSSATSPEVLPGDLAKVYATLNHWFAQLEARQRCSTPRFAVQDRVRGQLIVNGGAQAGLKPGDKLLLADGLRTPEDVLNSGVDRTMALAEVRWVGDEEAGLVVLSGSEPQGLANWVAMPL